MVLEGVGVKKGRGWGLRYIAEGAVAGNVVEGGILWRKDLWAELWGIQ